MRVLYLFVVYRSPEMIQRIISRLDDGKNLFLIHVDADSKEKFDGLRNKPNVRFATKRYHTPWGSPDLVFAVVDALKEAMQWNWDYVCLLSESDYPVKSVEYISDYLQNSNKDHILIKKLPCDNPLETPGGHWLEGGRRRYECYALRLTPKQIATIEPQKLNYGNLRQIVKILKYNRTKIFEAFRIIFKYPKRTRTIDALYGGHLWFFLKRKTIDAITVYINQHLAFYDDCKNTTCLDEIFFPTVVNAISNSKNISNKILRYISWTNNSSVSPVDISINDKNIIDECIKAEDILFIRKVTDHDVCEYIDSTLKGNMVTEVGDN